MGNKMVQGGPGWIESNPATSTQAGEMSAADKAKLDSLGVFNQISLTAGAQVGNSITVTGAVLDSAGNPVTAAGQVVVETFADTATAGNISTTVGSQQMNTGVPAGKLSSAVISTVNGNFVVDIEGSIGGNDFILVRVTRNGAIVGQINLHYAVG